MPVHQKPIGAMTLLIVLLMASAAQAALPTEGSRWAFGLSLRDPSTSSIWRVGPRFTCGLTLGTNVFARTQEVWSLDIDYRLTGKVLHHRSRDVSWFTFLEAGHSIREVDYDYGWYDSSEEELRDAVTVIMGAGKGIAWAPRERIGCFMSWGVVFEYHDYLEDWFSLKLDQIRLTGFWMF